MHLVHKGHEIMGRAVAAGGGKIARNLIAPAAIKGVFGDGHQFHMGIAHLFNVRDQLVSQLGVVVGNVLLLHLPASGVHLIDTDRSVDDVGLFLRFLPGGIMPGKAADVIHLAAVGRAGFGVERIRVCLINQFIRRGGNAIFIHVVCLDPRNEQLPNSLGGLCHGMAGGNPAVKIAHHGYGLGVRCPDTEHSSGLPILFAQVGAKIAVCLKVVSLMEQVNRQIRGFGRWFCLFHLLISPFL